MLQHALLAALVWHSRHDDFAGYIAPSVQEAGFDRFLRVGSLRRIAKPLLRNALHAANDSRDAATQLKQMLKEAAGPAEAQLIE